LAERAPIFFATPDRFRKWLEKNHGRAQELLVGLYKKGSGRPSITWPESVDEALCFGWIDGVRRSIDEDSYSIRFTPRRPGSIWSAVNVKRAHELVARGAMRPAGLAAFEARSDKKSGIYAYEQRELAKLTAAAQRQFRTNARAWEFFQKQPPWYRRTATYWVATAKKEETRQRRLATLIADSEQGRAIRQLARPGTPRNTGG
jgi:uncharacterized protein YdeI (YjbR/CyaY-like superfamily)